jgi:hypothetical protein
MSTNWRIYGNDTVATRLDRSDIPGFFNKQVVVGPNEAAFLVRDGESQAVVTESRLLVADVFEQIKSAFKMGADISVYFVELAPIDLTIFLGQQDAGDDKKTTQRSRDQERESSNRILRQFKGAANVSGDGSISGEVKVRPGYFTKLINALSGASGKAGWCRGRGNLAFDTNVDASVDLQHQSSATSELLESDSASYQHDVSRVSIVALSADREVINASCRIRLRIDESKSQNILSLLRGKEAVATWDLAALIRDQLLGKVLVPEIALHQSSDLRGNRDLLTQLESQARGALNETLNAFGLLLDDFSVTWGLTEQEYQEIEFKRLKREEQAKDFKNNRRIAEMAREQEIEKTRRANLQALKLADATGNNEYQKLLLASELERDLLVRNGKIDKAQIELKVQALTLQINKNDEQAHLEKLRARAEFQLEMRDREIKERHARDHARNMAIINGELGSLQRLHIEKKTHKHELEMEKRRQEIDAEFRKMQADVDDRYQQRKLKLEESMARMGMMERLVSQGLSDSKADTTTVLSDMLKQATEQEYATTTDAMVKARSEAEAVGKSLDTHRQAQADERTHQQGMTALAAEMMQAAKQSPAGSNLFCPHCRNSIQPSMKFCPFCGKSTSTSAT